jgi:hypothetical protein
MSFRGDVEIGRKIYLLLEKLGYYHTSVSFSMRTPEEFYGWSSQQRLEHYEEIFSHLKQADLAVFESSTQSVTIGQMIQESIASGIPLLVLTRPGSNLAYMDGLQESGMKMLKCDYTEDTLEKVLKEGLEYLSEMVQSRFTLILDGTIRRMLDAVAGTGNSRSEYIRELIRRDNGGE